MNNSYYKRFIQALSGEVYTLPIFLLITFVICGCFSAIAQDSTRISFFEKAPYFHAPRFYSGISLGSAAYGASLYGLSSAWYKDDLSSRFHFQNDWGQWQHVDKAGHSFTSYFESVWVSESLRWAGIPEKKALWYGAATALLFQTSVELLDAHSARWGFSWPDMGANALGAGLFVGQEYLWNEQRIQLKWSVQSVNYSNTRIQANNDTEAYSSAQQRATDLFGRSLAEQFLKDYNGQTVWASINISDFLDPGTQFPDWLSLSVGYGAENMYGANSNQWNEGNAAFDLNHLQAYRQFYIGPDINWSKIRTQSQWINSLLDMLNVLRLPFPAIEIDQRGRLQWHWLLI